MAPPKKPKPSTRMSIWFSPDEDAYLRRLAEKHRVKTAQILRWLVQDAFERKWDYGQ